MGTEQGTTGGSKGLDLGAAWSRARSSIESMGQLRFSLAVAAIVGFWLVYLIDKTSSYYSLDVLAGVLAIAGASVVSREGLLPEGRGAAVALAVLAVLASGVNLVSNYASIDFGLMSTVAFLAGIVVYYLVFRLLFEMRLPGAAASEHEPQQGRRALKVFAASFCAIVLIDAAYLLSYAFPGSLTSDSMSQVSQVLSGSYSNHHPFWHTMIIKACLDTAAAFGADINAQVATFSFVQIVLMAAIFSLALSTLAQLGARRGLLAIAFCLFALLPFNIAYSVTVWKDVLFGGTVLLFAVSLARVLLSVGKHQWGNYALLFLSSVCFGVLRNNGLFALIVMVVVLALLFWKKRRALVACVGGQLSSPS